MTERGTVKQIQNRQQVSIQLETQAACSSCGNTLCKSNRQSILALNPDELDLNVGDSVEVTVDGRAQAIGAFWVLLFPLILFLAGYFIGRLAFSRINEAPAALCGLCGLVIGMVGGVFIQSYNKQNSMPRVVRVLPAELTTIGVLRGGEGGGVATLSGAQIGDSAGGTANSAIRAHP